jgi:hypothetical protein
LTPGTEYAVPEKLPLPPEWYKDWEREGSAGGSSAGEAATMTGADVDDSSSFHTLSLSRLLDRQVFRI